MGKHDETIKGDEKRTDRTQERSERDEATIEMKEIRKQMRHER